MRFTLRLKLFAIVGVATIALISLTVSSSLSEHAVERQIDSIRDTYLPKIRLRPALAGTFEHLVRTIQNAVEAADPDLLAPASAERDAVLAMIVGARDAMTVGQSAALRLAIDDYFDSAVATSRQLIAGDGGEAATLRVQDMQAKRVRAAALIDQITSFDEQALAAAFAATKSEQRAAMIVRVVGGAICLVTLLVISLWIGNVLFANLGSLVAGFERFGRNDFDTPIASTSRDELGDVATQANKMAEQLHRLDAERARHEWIRTGQAGLSDELRGELEPAEVANRTVAYLARYLQSPVAVLYHRRADGRYTRLGGYAIPDGAALDSFAAGDGVLGQAVTRHAITVIDVASADDPGLELRSGLVAAKPRTLVFLPLTRSDSVTGVIELAAVRPWRDIDGELLELVRETIAITLEVAKGRAAARAHLEQTRQQACELERASATLRQKAEELEEASAYKSRFLANMSHELRTPLNAIIGFSELMYDGSVPLDEETTHEYLGDILSSGRHLLQLINDVLDLAKVEAGKLEFFAEPIELSRVVGEVLAVLRSASSKHQVVVTSEIEAAVERLVLDPGRLKQVLYNYLSNALKFTPPKGRVTIRASAVGDRVRIEVEDTGLGIPPDQVGRLFADFQQTEDGARKGGGTGLGLALTKRLVEAQGGEVGVRSVVGKGSTFFATLPRETVATGPRSPLQIVRAAANGPAILVVEDEAADRAQLVNSLSAAGYAVESVTTGAEAVQCCRKRAYDAITLDLLLPDMTGLEVLNTLREGPNGDVPVIVITVVAERGAVAGFAVHDVLAKPFSENALLESLHRAGLKPNNGRSTVLVVDDDATSLKVMAASLTRLGYGAVCEQDPVRGLRTAIEAPPSAIVLDLLMPGMTGFEFLEQLRTTEAARSVPVIVWTSKDLAVDEIARLRRSAQAVVSKGEAGNARVLAELESFMHIRGDGTA
jgi:signal transduction histidine kinase/CheY-like chemotaxis protein